MYKLSVVFAAQWKGYSIVKPLMAFHVKCTIILESTMIHHLLFMILRVLNFIL
jgi:hypothetical protein